MDQEKDQEQEGTAAWDRKVRMEKIHCRDCQQRISYEDSRIYFRTGKCGFCAHPMKRKH